MDKDLGEKLAVALDQLETLHASMERVLERLDKLESKFTFIGGAIAGVSFLWIIITQAIPWVIDLLKKKVGL